MTHAVTGLFLYGDITDTFTDITAPFVDAVIARGPTIALLLQGGHEWERYVARYRTAFEARADVNVLAVVPDPEGTVDESAFTVVEAAAGIFMGGGDTETYHAAFVASPTGDLIRRRFDEGVPYGGVSAGATLACQTSILAGNAIAGRPVMAVTEDEDLSDIRLGPGLSLLADAIVQPHFTEVACLPRLVAAMELTSTGVGLGIDEPAGLYIEGSIARVLGSGAAHVLHRADGRIVAQRKRPGETFHVAEHASGEQ